MRPFLSLAILNFNEAATLEQVVRSSAESLGSVGRSWEIVIVDDGSTDDSPAIIARLESETPRVRSVFHGRNLGIAAGIRTCYFETTGDWACWLPADGQADPFELSRFVGVLDSCDAVVTYRDSREREGSIARKAVSALDRLLTRALVGVSVRDLHWIRFFRRSLLDRMSLTSTTPFIDTEMLVECRRLGATIVEIPYPDRRRVAGDAKGGRPALLLRTAWELIRWRWRSRL